MDSINKNQPEDNRDDLRGGDAVERLRDMIQKAPNCFFARSVAVGDSGGVCPMNVRKVDDDGNLWFLSASDSHKNQEILADPRVSLYFQASQHSGFLTVNGNATISTDRVRIHELWEPILKTWFTGGVDDPRISVIKVVPTDGYYWDNKHGNLIAGAKMLLGAAIGKTLDDSIEGTIQP